MGTSDVQSVMDQVEQLLAEETLSERTELAIEKLLDVVEALSADRKSLAEEKETYTFGRNKYSRSEVTEELGWRFERLKEAQIVLESKKRLLSARERSLKSAMELLEKTRSQKRILASKIQGLESQHRLVKATAIGTGIKVDNSKLTQTEELIGEIKKRLDVAERILSHQSHFVQVTEIDVVDEKDLVQKIDEYMVAN